MIPSFRMSLVAIAALALSIPCVRALSARLLYPVSELAPLSAPDSAPEGFTRITTRARDGAVVRAFALDGPPRAPVVVVFHNNRETAADGAPLGRALRARGFGVVLVEYRGYGASRGAAPDEAGLYDDAEAVLDWLGAAGTRAESVVLWGRSLGSGVAAEMARRGRGGALVLVSPYTSIDRLVTDVVPFVPARVLVRDRFDTLSKAGAVSAPTLIVHGDADSIVPFAMGRTLAEAFPHARLLRVPHADHADVIERAGEALFDALGVLVKSRAR